LATIGYEVDHIAAEAENGRDVTDELHGLRERVSDMVSEVRDALYDLRTEVTESRDLVAVIREFATRVGQRANLVVALETSQTGRVSLIEERELWQITREAIRNVERHAQARSLRVFCHETASQVLISVVDDGIGLLAGAKSTRHDSYGIVGMRERAARVGATLDFRTPAFGGTEVRIVLRTNSRSS
jgi:signal transduction histidine kinase